MGAYTPNAQVWYPDITDTAKLNTLLSTMASSIENGIGSRLKLQETAVGLKAGIATSFGINNTQATIPFTVGSNWGEFNNGFTFNNGVATVQTAGMYLVSSAIGINPNATYSGVRSGIIWLMKGSTTITYGEMAMNGTFVVSAQCTAVMNCVPGDTIYVRGSTGGGATTGVALNNAGYPTYLSIALVQALPL